MCRASCVAKRCVAAHSATKKIRKSRDALFTFICFFLLFFLFKIVDTTTASGEAAGGRRADRNRSRRRVRAGAVRCDAGGDHRSGRHPWLPLDDEPGPVSRLAAQQGPAGRARLGRHHQVGHTEDLPGRGAEHDRSGGNDPAHQERRQQAGGGEPK